VDTSSVAELAGLIGRVLLVAGAALFVVSVLAVVPGVLRVRRRAFALRAAAGEARRDALTGLALLEAQRAETEALLAPWRTLLRWVRHPLVVATLEWYRRRRSAERRSHR
jgi:hypothetical protein